MTIRETYNTFLVALAIVIAGCSQPTEPSGKTTPTGIDGSDYVLVTEPEGATGVIKVREQANDQDDVVIVGRIGGSEDPWVEGLAAFSIVDPSLKSCLECGADECPKPWDYC